MIEQVYAGILPGPFLDLCVRSYGQAMPREVFDWKYVGHPHGDPVAWTVSEREDGPWIGVMVLHPRLYRHAGRKLLAGQLIDLMVDRSHRRRGLFRAITQRIVEEHRQFGFDLIFTVPATGGMSIDGFRAMPYLSEVGQFRSYRRFWRLREPLTRKFRSTWAAAAIDPLLRVWLRRGIALTQAPTTCSG